MSTGSWFVNTANGCTGDVFWSYSGTTSATPKNNVTPKYIILQDVTKKAKQIKTPETTCDKYDGGYRISFKKPEIGLYAFGKSEKEAYNNFWRYITELIPRLEEGRKVGALSAYMENVLDYLQGKTPCKEPLKRWGRIVITADDRKYLNPKFPAWG